MKLFTIIWDMILFVFAYSTTKHCDKINLDIFEENRSSKPQKKEHL